MPASPTSTKSGASPAPPGKTHGRGKYSSRNIRYEEPLSRRLLQVAHHRRLSVTSRENRSITPFPRSLLLGGALTLRFLRALWLGLRRAAWFRRQRAAAF